MRHPLIVMLAVLVSVSSIRAADDKPTDPKSVAKAFAQALIDGDAEAATKLFDGNDKSKELIEPLAAVPKAFDKAAAAAKAKFGKDGESVFQKSANQSFLEKIKASDEKIDGDEATLARARATQDPIRLRRTADGWKIYKLPAAMMNSRGQVVAMRRALEIVAEGIAKGEYKSAQESYDAVRTKAHDIAIHSTTQQ